MAPCLLLRLHGDPMITGSLAPWIFGWIVLHKNMWSWGQGVGKCTYLFSWQIFGIVPYTRTAPLNLVFFLNM